MGSGRGRSRRAQSATTITPETEISSEVAELIANEPKFAKTFAALLPNPRGPVHLDEHGQISVDNHHIVFFDGTVWHYPSKMSGHGIMEVAHRMKGDAPRKLLSLSQKLKEQGLLHEEKRKVEISARVIKANKDVKVKDLAPLPTLSGELSEDAWGSLCIDDWRIEDKWKLEELSELGVKLEIAAYVYEEEPEEDAPLLAASPERVVF